MCFGTHLTECVLNILSISFVRIIYFVWMVGLPGILSYIPICIILVSAASMRLCMGSRRGFICRMKIGQTPIDGLTSSHTVRIRQRNTLGPSSDGQQYAVVHVTGYIKNWPPSGEYRGGTFISM